MRRGLALVLAMASLQPACHRGDTEETETAAAVPVSVAPARTGDIRGVVSATGLVGAAPGAEQIVVPPQQARIAAMPKAVGDTVRKGELLVRFEAPALQADVAAKEAGMAQATARLENSHAARERVAGLLARGIAAQKEMDEAQKELRDAEAGVAQARAEQAAARQVAERATVTALFDGIIAQRTHNPGDLVEAASAEPILRLLDASHLQIEAAVPFADLLRVRVGSAARILPPGAGREGAVPAQVSSVPAAVRTETGTAPVRLSFTGAPRLAAGLPVAVEIDAELHSGVVLVPAAALVREEDKVFAYVVDAAGKAHRREVVLGLESGADAEIVTGIATGEKTVVKGQQSLPDGAAVTVGG